MTTTPCTTTQRTKTPRTRFLLAIAAVATIAATAGCSGSDSPASSDDSLSESRSSIDRAASAPNEAGGSSGREDSPVGDSLMSDAGAPEASQGADGNSDKIGGSEKSVDVQGPSVISTGNVSLESDDVGAARLEVRKILDKYRGTVTEQETSTGDKGEVTTARLVLRVPSNRFAEALKEMEDVATFIDSNSSGQDVSTEVVDVEARIRAQRKSVARIESLLARAESLEQIVTIESQLSARQADLDALLSRQTYLKDQTSQSTINVYIQQPDEEEADEPDEEEAGGFVGGLHDGWDSFVTGFSAVLTVVGFLLPWLVLLALLGIPARLLLKRRVRATA